MKSPLLLTGIGLRTQHYCECLEKKPKVAWLEVHSENYFGQGGKPLNYLEKIRKDYPISLHGVSLSIGSTDDLNWQQLKKLRDLSERIEPCLISDHVCFSSVQGQYLHDLLPVPYTDESLDHIVARVQQVQEYLQRQILLENITAYVNYESSTLAETQFLSMLADRSGCGLILDVANVYINATNFSSNPNEYISAIPAHHVQEIHLAGFSTVKLAEKEILIDAHNKSIVPAVWDLYRYTIQTLGHKPTIIEWDSDVPALETLYLEAFRAEKIMRESNVIAKSANGI